MEQTLYTKKYRIAYKSFGQGCNECGMCPEVFNTEDEARTQINQWKRQGSWASYEIIPEYVEWEKGK